MNPLSPDNLISDVVPSLDGISLDLSTVIIGMLGIILILIGADLIKDVLLGRLQAREDEKAEKELWWAYQGRGNKYVGDKQGFEKDLYEARYQRALSKFKGRGR